MKQENAITPFDPTHILGPHPFPPPQKHFFGWNSDIWSGYVKMTPDPGTYLINQAAGEFIVPSVNSNPPNNRAAVSIWVGIDGGDPLFVDGIPNDNTGQLIQIGVVAGDFFTGSLAYNGFWEIYMSGQPHQGAPIPSSTYPVNPGDKMFAEVFEDTNQAVWVMKLTNVTQGWTFVKDNISYTGVYAQRTAEFIVEAMQTSTDIGVRKVIPLANYGVVEFNNCYVNGENAGFFDLASGYACGKDGLPISIPSLPNKLRNGFYVNYNSVPFNEIPVDSDRERFLCGRIPFL